MVVRPALLEKKSTYSLPDNGCQPPAHVRSEVESPPLPADVLLEIIPYLSSTSLVSLSMASILHRNIIQPFIFTRITFHPFYNPRVGGCPVARNISDRIAFLTSPRIAPRIKECLILPLEHGDSAVVSQEVQIILASLHSFPTFQRLFMQRVYLDAPVLKQLCSLPPLDILSLESCPHSGIPATEGTISIRSLYCDRNSSGVPLGIASLAPHLNADHLRSLTIGTTDVSYALHLININQTSFQILVALDITESILTSPELALTLGCLVNLKHLRLRHSNLADAYKTPADIPLSCLPSLISYEGPYSLAPALAKGRSLQKFILWPADAEAPFYSERHLCHFIQQLGPATTHLDIGSVFFSMSALLKTISETFTRLQHLAVNAHPASLEPSMDSEGFAAALEKIELPSTLESLDLGIDYDPLAEDLQPLIDILASCIGTCINFQTARFWHDTFGNKNCLVWQRPPWASPGTVVFPSSDDITSEFCEDVNDFHVRCGKFPQF